MADHLGSSPMPLVIINPALFAGRLHISIMYVCWIIPHAIPCFVFVVVKDVFISLLNDAFFSEFEWIFFFFYLLV